MHLCSLTPLVVGAALAGGAAHREPGTLGRPAAPTQAASATILAAASRPNSIATVTLHVEGMTCGGCVLGVRKVLTRLEGVTKADVSYETKLAVVRYDPAKVAPQQMIDAIATLRYTATVVAPGPRTPAATSAKS